MFEFLYYSCEEKIYMKSTSRCRVSTKMGHIICPYLKLCLYNNNITESIFISLSFYEPNHNTSIISHKSLSIIQFHHYFQFPEKWVLIATIWDSWRRSVWVLLTSVLSSMANGKPTVLLFIPSILPPIRLPAFALFFFPLFFIWNFVSVRSEKLSISSLSLIDYCCNTGITGSLWFWINPS